MTRNHEERFVLGSLLGTGIVCVASLTLLVMAVLDKAF